MHHGVVIFDFTAKVWLFFSCARDIWSDPRGKVLITARGLQKDAERAPCAHEGQRDDHVRSARVSDKTATFWAISASLSDTFAVLKVLMLMDVGATTPIA